MASADAQISSRLRPEPDETFAWVDATALRRQEPVDLTSCGVMAPVADDVRVLGLAAIEHMGRKVPGVEEVRVYPDSQEIHVRYGGDPAAIGEIIRIVGRLGYEARLRTGA